MATDSDAKVLRYFARVNGGVGHAMDDGTFVRANIRLLTAADGGRTTSVRGSYRPNHNFFRTGRLRHDSWLYRSTRGCGATSWREHQLDHVLALAGSNALHGDKRTRGAPTSCGPPSTSDWHLLPIACLVPAPDAKPATLLTGRRPPAGAVQHCLTCSVRELISCRRHNRQGSGDHYTRRR
jgi:hypothetical protein